MTPEKRTTIQQAIMGMNHKDLKDVYGIINEEWDAAERKAMTTFRKGMVVEFTHKGQVISGTVERVNTKTLSLGKRGAPCSDGRLWKVSPSNGVKVIG